MVLASARAHFANGLFLVLMVQFLRWKAGEFNGAGDPGGVNELTVCEAIHHKQFRTVNGQKRWIG